MKKVDKERISEALVDEQYSQKVTAFVIRKIQDQLELLLINHPRTAYQLPAGTVKEEESHHSAIIRETLEETGLEDVKILKELKTVTINYKKKARILNKPKIHSLPRKSSSTFGRLREGIKVKILRESNNFMQVRYREREENLPGKPIMLSITGWIERTYLSRVEKRSFFVLTTGDRRESDWEVSADYHMFRLEWHNIEKLPQLTTKQSKWLYQNIEDLKNIELKGNP